jgi:hypothetical protein
MVKKLEDLQVIKPYQPQLPPTLTSAPPTFSRRNLFRQSSGLYTLGYGEKSVVWYWEFDTENRYFHEFQTVNFTQAMKIYQESKFDIWDKSWRPPCGTRFLTVRDSES